MLQQSPNLLLESSCLDLLGLNYWTQLDNLEYTRSSTFLSVVGSVDMEHWRQSRGLTA